MSLNKAFREIGRVDTERSAFDLSHTHLTTFNMGWLYPVLTKFTMPGDKWHINLSNVVRAMPMPYPAYVDIDINYHFYFVPYRLLWDDFEDFITGGEKGDFTATMPKKQQDRYSRFYPESSLARLGLVCNDGLTYGNFTTILSNELKPSILPFRAYCFIWNEYYRDQNLMSKIDYLGLTESLTSLNFEDNTRIPPYLNSTLPVSWLKDYYTSALPFQQRGTAPVLNWESSINSNIDRNIVAVSMRLNNNAFAFTDVAAPIGSSPSTKNVVSGASSDVTKPAQSGYFNHNIDYLLKNGLSVVSNYGLTISDLRTAVQIQKFLERNARAGVRYTEFLQAHYNVSPSDSRLDRPEFIGGCKFPVVVSDVFQTSDTANQSTPLGSYAGRALTAGYDECVSYFVEEFGVIMGLAFLRPKTSYFQGVPREFQYNDRFEFPFPEFMHLSEQGITNSEIYVPQLPYSPTGDSVVTSASTTQKNFDPSAIFGYQGIYDELRWQPNRITGFMANSKDPSWTSWHLARIFTDNTAPKLNASFVACRPRSDIFNITDPNVTPEFIAQIKFDIKAVRPMPIIGEPGLVDHF